jgi:tetratricopeptide (TPR) repeat protein
MMTRIILTVVGATAAFAANSERFEKGLKLYRSGDCAAALMEFDASETSGEQAPERPFYYGVCLTKQGDWAKGEKQLASYANTHETEASAWYWLAQAQLYQKHFEEARQSITRSTALDSKSADGFRTLGEIELERKDYDAAFRAWLTANKLNPLDPRTAYYLGRLFFEADIFNEAAAWFRETLKLAPDHYAAMTYLAMSAERLNLDSTAVDLYRAAIRESKKQNKPYPWAYVNLAKLLRQSGKEQEAFALLVESEKLCPEAHGLTVLGQMLAAANQKDKAEAMLRRAIAMDASIPDAHYRLALLLRSSGRTAEAQAEMKSFQEAKQAEERNKVKINAVRKDG